MIKNFNWSQIKKYQDNLNILNIINYNLLANKTWFMLNIIFSSFKIRILENHVWKHSYLENTTFQCEWNICNLCSCICLIYKVVVFLFCIPFFLSLLFNHWISAVSVIHLSYNFNVTYGCCNPCFLSSKSILWLQMSVKQVKGRNATFSAHN